MSNQIFIGDTNPCRIELTGSVNYYKNFVTVSGFDSYGEVADSSSFCKISGFVTLKQPILELETSLPKNPSTIKHTDINLNEFWLDKDFGLISINRDSPFSNYIDIQKNENDKTISNVTAKINDRPNM